MLARCRICGASGTHKQCSNLTTIENWACETCLAVELRSNFSFSFIGHSVNKLLSANVIHMNGEIF